MCGRFKLEAPFAELVALYNLNILVALNLAPRWNIAPSQDVPVVVKDEPQNRLVMKRWGLIPYWAKDAKVGYSMLNARADALTAKPAWREPFKRGRCLVVADGFYEWQRAGKAKLPWLYTVDGGKPFAFAGLWDNWKSPEGTVLSTCAIVTTEANALAAEVHDRMPVILDPAAAATWLDPKAAEGDLLALAKPFPPERMAAVRVNPAMNNANNEGAEYAAPLTGDEEPEAAPTLF